MMRAHRMLGGPPLARIATARPRRRPFGALRPPKKGDLPLLLLSWYKRKLDSHPLLTKGTTSGAISSAGDGICQRFSPAPAAASGGGGGAFDWWRNLRFFLMGSFVVAPCTHFWYGYLNLRLFPGPSTLVTVSKRVAVDQFGFAVLFQPTFMGILWSMEGRSRFQITEQLVEVVPSVLVANWSLWIPAMSINFAFVPVNFQVLFGNVVALLWTTYVSYKSAQVVPSMTDAPAH